MTTTARCVMCGKPASDERKLLGMIRNHGSKPPEGFWKCNVCLGYRPVVTGEWDVLHDQAHDEPRNLTRRI